MFASDKEEVVFRNKVLVSAIGSSHPEQHEVEYFGARLANNGVSAAAFKRQTTTKVVCLTSQKALNLALRYQSS